jgi:hypothetical protein
MSFQSACLSFGYYSGSLIITGAGMAATVMAIKTILLVYNIIASVHLF